MKLNAVAVTKQCCCLEEIMALAKEAFPPEEYLSPYTLIEMSEAGELDFWALYDKEQFVGFMAVKVHRNMAYLFFLAILPELRSSGYGGRALAALKALYPSKQQVVDIEMPDAAAANRAQREKRRAFYLRNGYQETGQFLSYLGVDYEVLCMEDTFDWDSFKELMLSLRIEGFHPHFFTCP